MFVESGIWINTFSTIMTSTPFLSETFNFKGILCLKMIRILTSWVQRTYSILLILFKNYIVINSHYQCQGCTGNPSWCGSLLHNQLNRRVGVVWKCCICVARNLKLKKFSKLKLLWNGLLCALFVCHLCKRWVIQLAPVVRKEDNTFHYFDKSLVDIAFPEPYLLNSALSSGYLFLEPEWALSQ